jgi:DNA-binding NarL/FixJ family response regulator
LPASQRPTLTSSPDCTLVAAVPTVAAAERVPAAAADRVNVLVVGADVPDLEGPRGIRRLLTGFPRARLLVLGAGESPATILAFLHVGATGYLPAPVAASAVPPALRAVHAGAVVLPRTLGAVLLAALQQAGPAAGQLGWAGTLSRREQEVLVELVRGYSNAAIAQRLGVAETTVKTHVKRILRKSGARNRFVLHARLDADAQLAS